LIAGDEGAVVDAIYEELVRGAADAVIASDRHGRIVLWNDAAETLFGYPRDRMLGVSVSCLVSERNVNAFENWIAAAFAAGKPRTSPVTVMARSSGDSEFPVEVAVSIAGTGNDAIAVGIVRRVDERFNQLALLTESERRLREAEQLAGMGSFEWSVGSDQITWSDQLARIYGYEPRKHPKTLEAFMERVHPDDRSTVQQNIGQALADGSSWSMDERIVRADNGETRVLASQVSVVRDAQGKIVRLSGICHDVTEQRRVEEALVAAAQAEEKLRERGLHDAVTALPNRDLLIDRLSASLARVQRGDAPIGVLLVDLESFKMINDAVGHVAGDEILRTVASRLVAASRSGDTVARVGGDEFIVVCEGLATQDELLAFADRLIASLTASVVIGAQEFNMTVNVGIAVGHGSEQPEQLLRDADLALFRAKQRGKNSVELFDETLRLHAFDRIEVDRDLRRALQEDEIEPFYQPIIALESGRISGFEALARWHHPKRGLVLPGRFLTIAEDAHLIGPLGTAMLRVACHQLARWQVEHPELTMAVNLSLRQLDTDFTQTVADVLKESGVPPRSLHMEVTESVLLDLEKTTASQLNSLAGLGVQVGIDDFGTGYSSLLYIKRFPVRFLKIDRSFVSGLAESLEDMAIVQAVVRLGQSLKLPTIAEGVETAEQLELLRRIGCTHAQGYHIGEPKPAAECRLEAL